MMGKGRRGRKLITLALGVPVLLVAALALEEPALDAWHIWRLGDESTWRSAAETLCERESDWAIPHVAEAALTRDTENFIGWHERLVRIHGADALRALPVYRRGLSDGRARVRRQALGALRRTPPRTVEVVAIFQEGTRSDDPVVRWQSAYALAELGPVALPALESLESLLQDGQADVRWAAVVALGSLASETERPVRALARMLRDPEPRVACYAAKALAGFGSRAAAAVPALREALRADGPVRVHAAEALGAIGSRGRAAVPRLVEALGRPFSGATAYDGLVWIRADLRERPPAPRELRQRTTVSATRRTSVLSRVQRPSFFAEDDLVGQAHVVHALGETGPTAAAALPQLLSLLHHRHLRFHAARAVGRLAPHFQDRERREARDALIEALVYDLPETRRPFTGTSAGNLPAAWALGRLGPSALVELTHALERGLYARRAAAAYALGWSGPPARAALGHLERALEDPVREVRLAAALALLRIDSGVDVTRVLLDAGTHIDLEAPARIFPFALEVAADPRSLPLLEAALKDDDPLRRAAAARLLATLGPSAARAVPELIARLEGDESDAVQLAAAVALGRFPSRRREIVPVLVETLRAGGTVDRRTVARRLAVVESLEELAAAKRSVVAVLLDAYRDGWETRRSAAGRAGRADGNLGPRLLEALGVLGRGSPAAVAVLVDALRGAHDPELAREAAAALAELGPPGEALPALRGALEHGDVLVRVRACRALFRAGERTREIVSILRGVLRDPGGWEPRREPSAVSSGTLRYPALFGLRSPAHPARREAVACLAEMGSAAEELRPDVTRLLDTPDLLLRVGAVEALWRIGGEARVDVLLEVLAPLADGHWEVPDTVDEVLVGSLDGETERARGYRRLLPVIRRALGLLAEMGPRSRQALPVVEEFLRGPRPVREAAKKN